MSPYNPRLEDFKYTIKQEDVGLPTYTMGCTERLLEAVRSLEAKIFKIKSKLNATHRTIHECNGKIIGWRN